MYIGFVARNFTMDVSTYTMYVSPYRLFIDMRDRTWVKFRVQTSRNAIVGLFNRTHLAYEIIIGAESNYCYIR